MVCYFVFPCSIMVFIVMYLPGSVVCYLVGYFDFRAADLRSAFTSPCTWVSTRPLLTLSTPGMTARYLTVTAGVAARYLAVIVRVLTARYPAALPGVTVRYLTVTPWLPVRYLTGTPVLAARYLTGTAGVAARELAVFVGPCPQHTSRQPMW